MEYDAAAKETYLTWKAVPDKSEGKRKTSYKTSRVQFHHRNRESRRCDTPTCTRVEKTVIPSKEMDSPRCDTVT